MGLKIVCSYFVPIFRIGGAQDTVPKLCSRCRVEVQGEAWLPGGSPAQSWDGRGRNGVGCGHGQLEGVRKRRDSQAAGSVAVETRELTSR